MRTPSKLARVLLVPLPRKMADFGWEREDVEKVLPEGIKAFDTMQGPVGLLGTRPLCPSSLGYKATFIQPSLSLP